MVSASWNGTGVASPVEVVSWAGRDFVFRSPWSRTTPPHVMTMARRREMRAGNRADVSVVTTSDGRDGGGAEEGRGYWIRVQGVAPGLTVGSWWWPTERGRRYRISETGSTADGRTNMGYE